MTHILFITIFCYLVVNSMLEGITMKYIVNLKDINLTHLNEVGGKKRIYWRNDTKFIR